MEQFRIIDLPPLKVPELNQLVNDLAPKYQVMMQDEIHLMTLIEDPKTSIKNAAVCKEKEKELRKKLFCNFSFTQISDDVLQLAIQRCEGNPLITLHYLFNLLAVTDIHSYL